MRVARRRRAQARRRGVEQLAGRVEAPLERGAERGQRVQAPGQVVQQRPAVVGQDVAQAARRPRWSGRWRRTATASSRPPRAARSTAGPMSWAPPIPALGCSARSARTCAGLLEADLDEHRVGQRDQRLGEAAAGREPRRGGQPLADQRELEEGDRLGVHQPAPRSRRPAGGDRRRTATAGRPSPGPAIGDADPWGRCDHERRIVAPDAAPGAGCRAGSSRSRPSSAGSTPKAARQVRRADGEPRVGDAGEPRRPRRPGRGRRRAASRSHAPAAPRAWRRHPRAARRREGGRRRDVRAGRRRRSGRCACRRHRTRRRGPARRTSTRPATGRPNRACEARSSGPAYASTSTIRPARRSPSHVADEDARRAARARPRRRARRGAPAGRRRGVSGSARAGRTG